MFGSVYQSLSLNDAVIMMTLAMIVGGSLIATAGMVGYIVRTLAGFFR